jgi:pantetheine-phosphate adenylyltransferase
MKIAIYPGTFDPMTLGHVDIVTRACQFFDRIVIGVATSARKAPFLSLTERVQLAQVVFADHPQVQVDSLEELLVDFAVSHQAQTIVRGIRHAGDYVYEADMAHLNRQLRSSLDTVFLPTQAHYQAISSTMVREIYSLGGDVSQFVPTPVFEFLLRRRKHGA